MMYHIKIQIIWKIKCTVWHVLLYTQPGLSALKMKELVSSPLWRISCYVICVRLSSPPSVVWFQSSAPHCLNTTSGLCSVMMTQPIGSLDLMSPFPQQEATPPLEALHFVCVRVCVWERERERERDCEGYHCLDCVWTLSSRAAWGDGNSGTLCYMLKLWIWAWWEWTFISFPFLIFSTLLIFFGVWKLPHTLKTCWILLRSWDFIYLLNISLSFFYVVRLKIDC